jgi:hypothetical protein
MHLLWNDHGPPYGLNSALNRPSPASILTLQCITEASYL